MRSLIFAAFLTIASAASAFAQDVAPGQKFTWKHAGTDVTHFQVCIDGTAPANCTTVPGGATVREAPIPALVPGQHTWTVNTCGLGGCALSEIKTFRLVAVPVPATDLEIK